MTSINLQILCFFFIFPVIIHSKASCPLSSCGSNSFVPVRYPFILETDKPIKKCQNYINLRCNGQGQTILNLPSYGDFYASFIDYYSSIIDLQDPEDCLPRRLMTNFSLYPLQAIRYKNYTYYTCPRKTTRQEFPYIECMSNSTNVTLAISGISPESMERAYGCQPIATSQIPVSSFSEDEYPVISDYFQLTWNVSACQDCEEFDHGKSGDSKSKWPKFFSSPLFIPSVVVLVAFFGLACILRILKLTAGRYNTNTDNSPTNIINGRIPESVTSTTTGDTPNEANRIDQSSKVYTPCTEILVITESQGSSLPNGETSCSICLDEYQGKDKVRYLSQCGHYFHAGCVDQWLHKHTTCPVCRTKLSSSHM